MWKISEIPVNANFLVRLTAQTHKQDGFRTNNYSGSDSTNMKNEYFYRAKVHWLVNDNLTVKYMHFNTEMDNSASELITYISKKTAASG